MYDQHEITPRESGAERCNREIEAVLKTLRSGEPDEHGQLLGLVDWSNELRLLEQSNGS